jgi:hypothetical protein
MTTYKNICGGGVAGGDTAARTSGPETYIRPYENKTKTKQTKNNHMIAFRTVLKKIELICVKYSTQRYILRPTNTYEFRRTIEAGQPKTGNNNATIWSTRLFGLGL